MPNIKPFWLSADLKALDVTGTNNSLAGLIQQTQATVDLMVAPIRATATKSAEINQRLKTWYTAQIQDVSQPIEDLANATAAFLEDVWSTGVHAYIPMPEVGGYGYLRRAMSVALSSHDPNAPTFSDQMEVGGVMLMVAGGQLQVFIMAATIAALTGGNPQMILSDLMRILAESSGLSELNQDIGNLVRMPQAAWSDTQQKLAQWWESSPVSKMADPATFPASLFNDLSSSMPSYDPAIVGANQDFTLTIKGSGFTARTAVLLEGSNPDGSPLKAMFSGAQLVIKNGSEIKIDVSKENIKKAGVLSLKLATLKGNSPSNIKDVGIITVSPGGIGEALAEAGKQMMGNSVFNSWKALGVGTALNAMVPGAAVIADQAVNLLDNAGAAVDSAANGVIGGLDSVGSSIVNGLDAIADVTDKVGGMAAGFLDDLSKLAVGIMVIPPAKGGVHQLNWALNQGFSEFALNAPLVDEDMAVAGIFLCAGAPNGAEVMASLKKVGTVFGIKELENL